MQTFWGTGTPTKNIPRFRTASERRDYGYISVVAAYPPTDAKESRSRL